MDKKREQEQRMRTIIYDLDYANGQCVDCDKSNMNIME